MALLDICNVNITYDKKNIVSDVSLSIDEGQILGIVGKSGCGKSTLLKAILNILPDNAALTSGKIFYKGQNLNDLSKKSWQEIRGRQISMIFQNAKTSFCPVRTIGQQLYETIAEYSSYTKKEIFAQAIDLFDKIRLQNGEKILNSYPFELSGGTNQRIAIAIAMLLKPKLLLADEPTSALDVVSQMQVIKEMMKLQQIFQTSIILVSHNINLVSRVADKIAIMQEGKIVEYNFTERIMHNPQHQFTKELLQSIYHL